LTENLAELLAEDDDVNPIDAAIGKGRASLKRPRI
jgi:hypothetical protein